MNQYSNNMQFINYLDLDKTGGAPRSIAKLRCRRKVAELMMVYGYNQRIFMRFINQRHITQGHHPV